MSAQRFGGRQPTFPKLESLVDFGRGEITRHLVKDDVASVVGRHVAVHASSVGRRGLVGHEAFRHQLGESLRTNRLALASVGANDEHKPVDRVDVKVLEVEFVVLA